MEGVQGVLTLFCSGAAQVCHDDRVVELSELEPKGVRCHHQAVEQRCASQCMYVTRPLKCRCNVSTSSLVSCLVSCLLYASFHLFVCDDAVVRRTLVLIALYRSHCFHRSHFTLDFAVLEV